MPWATSVSTSISRLVTPDARSPGGTAGRWRPAAAMPRESAASEQVGDHVGVGTRVSGQARPHRSDVRRLGAVRGRHGGVAEMLDGADCGRRDGEQHLVVTVTGRPRQRHERVQVAEAGVAGEQDSHDTLRESRGRRPFDGVSAVPGTTSEPAGPAVIRCSQRPNQRIGDRYPVNERGKAPPVTDVQDARVVGTVAGGLSSCWR